MKKSTILKIGISLGILMALIGLLIWGDLALFLIGTGIVIIGITIMIYLNYEKKN